MSELLKAVESIGGAIDTLRAAQDQRMAALQDRVEQIEAKSDRPQAGGRFRAETKAFNLWARTGQGLPTEGKAMSMGTAADGGALVPEVIASEIIDKALAQGGLAQLVRRTPVTTSDYVRLVNCRGQAASWSSETGTRSEGASVVLREVRPTHGELYAVVSTTNWLLQDSQFDVARLIVDNAAAQFARALETAVLSGTGSSQPTGIIYNAPTASADTASPQRAADVIERVNGGSHLGDDLVTLYFRLKPAYRRRASFVMTSATLAAVRKLRDANGSGYLFQPRLDGAVDAADGTILGKPVFTCEDMSSYGDGSPQVLCVLCGDFQQGYELTEIGPMSVLRDPYSTKGKTLFYVAARFGGRLTDNDAIKILAG